MTPRQRRNTRPPERYQSGFSQGSAGSGPSQTSQAAVVRQANEIIAAELNSEQGNNTSDSGEQESDDTDNDELPDINPEPNLAPVLSFQNGSQQQADLLVLQGRAQPEVPQPVAVGHDQVGWKAIDRLGGWSSFLVECRMLEEVPEQHKGAWANAWCEIL